MNEKTLKFNNVEVNKKEFSVSKQIVALNLVSINQILISDKFKHSDTGFKYLIHYNDDIIIRDLSIILLQMSGYIRCFDNGEKIMSFMLEDDGPLVKYNNIWNKTKEMLNMPVHNKKT